MHRALIISGLLLSGGAARGGEAAFCPAARDLPQLTIDVVREPAVPVVDEWQVLWGDVPLSDHQLALLGKEDLLIERTQKEMASRGTWVYVGMGTAALGAAVSSVGWVLYGQNQLSQGVTLSMAAGGLLVGLLGTLFVTDAIQTPLEPHLAPTPAHRLSRDEARRLVALVNARLYREICEAAATGAGAPTPDQTGE